MRMIVLVVLLAAAPIGEAARLPFLSDGEITALASEVSGESAKRTTEELSRHHRMRGSRGFRVAAESIVAELRRYGLADAHIDSFPADGEIFYGTQRSRPAWNAEFAELWELSAGGDRVARLASWDAAPITLAQDSVSGEVTTWLVDVGAGTSEADYEGKGVSGKLVLTSSQPGAIAALAAGQYGAAGIISYAQNQRTAWYGEDENLIRWGHLDTFAEERTFAFMVSLKTARALQQRLARGEMIAMHAIVRAGQQPGSYDIATATIPGTDLVHEEIVFSCHLDHPRPGANDNASGCAAILEVARTLSKLIREERIAAPRRTIRFVWPPEIEGTLALLNGRQDLAERIRAAVHLDMVGGGPETKAIFHVTRGPASQPSFIHDLAAAVGELAGEETARYAMTGSARWPLVASDGSRDPLRPALVPLTQGSDHQVYSDSSFGIPAIYLNDWPDRYIHTNRDVVANIDSTKLARASFIAAASGYALARISASDAPAVIETMRPHALRRAAVALQRNDANVSRFAVWYERKMIESLARFTGEPVSDDGFLARYATLLAGTGLAAAPRDGGLVVYRRNPEIRGTMAAFGYDYFSAHHPGAASMRLPEEHRYEALNLVDGRRSVAAIADDLSAIYTHVQTEDVEQYLAALASIDVVLRVPRAVEE